MKKDPVVSAAKNHLLSQPYDIAHDIFHHYKVWENVLLIILKESLSVDIEKLEIAAWWHDYERGSSEHLVLKNVMEDAGYSIKQFTSIKDLINSHSFNDERSNSEEAKVLFDADKLEYANSGRLMWMGEGILKGLLSPGIGREYGIALDKRIFEVVQTLNYPSTRNMMIQNLTNFIDVLPMCKSRYQELLANVQNDELVRAVEYLRSKTA